MPRPAILAAALLMAPLLMAGAAQARDGDAVFKDWWVGCDNVRVCTAYGFPPNEGDGAFLSLRRDAEAQALPQLEIRIGEDTSKGVSGALTLAVDGQVLARTRAPEGSEDDYRSWAVTAEEAPKVLAAIGRGQVLVAKAGSRTVATVSLSGASAALRWMDDQQKRAGGVTALIAKGAAPASAVPAPPPLPLIRAARPVSQAGLSEVPPPAVLARVKGLDCTGDTSDRPSADRLSPGVVLWTLPCWVGAYQTSSVLVLTDEKGGSVRLVDLGGPGDPDERAVATNAAFDADHQTLHSYAKGRGVGDCGFIAAYVWTGRSFVLANRQELSICRGLTSDLWVETFRSR